MSVFDIGKNEVTETPKSQEIPEKITSNLEQKIKEKDDFEKDFWSSLPARILKLFKEILNFESKKENITFDTVIEIFEKDFGLLSSVSILRWLKQTLNEENKWEVKALLLKICEAKDYDAINSHLKSLQKIADVYIKEKWSIIDKSKTAKALIPTEFLKDSDSIFTDHIKQKIEKADDLTIDQLVNEIKDIKIESKNIDKKNWDNFFVDLRDSIEEKDLPEFEKMVADFKKTDLYIKSSWDKKTPTVKNGNWAIWTINDIKDKAIDKFKSFGWLDIDKIWSELDNRVDEILQLPDSSNWAIWVEIWWVVYKFQTKKEALKSIYKAKLIFEELSNNTELLKSWGFISTLLAIESIPIWWTIALTSKAFDVWPVIWILWALLSTVIMAWVAWAHIVAIGWPIESILRNLQDVLATRLWDKWWSGWLKSVWTSVKGFDTSIKNNKIPFVWSVLKILRLFTTWPLSTVLNLWWAVLEKWEKATIESLLRNERINVVDWLFETSWKEVSAKQEMQQRVKILDFYKKKWKHDTERLKKIDTLVNPSKLVVWWQLNSLTETFYLKLFEIDKWQLILTSKGSWLKDKSWKVAMWVLHQTKHVFSFPNYKELIFADVNRWIKQQTESLKEIFKIKELDNWKIEISDIKTEFCIKIEWLIDLDWTISNEEELKRNKLFNEYIEKIKDLEIQDITPEKVKQDLVLISEWYLPKFKILEILKKEFDLTSDKEIKSRIQKFMDNVNEWKWSWTDIELTEAIKEVKVNRFPNKEELRDSKYIEDKLKRGASLLVIKFSLEDAEIKNETEFLKYFEKEIKINQMLKGLKSNESIERELRKLYSEIKWWKVNGIDLVKNDFTKGHLNYIVRQLLAWETYEKAKTPLKETGFNRVNTSHQSKEVLLQKSRWELLVKMAEEITEVAKETEVWAMQKKLKEFQDNYKIEGDLEVYMKEEGVRYNKIVKDLNKLNHALELDLKQFVEREWRELKWKAVELIDKAKLTNPNKSSEISVLKDMILRTKEAISIVQFENALKAIMYWSNTWELSITDIRNLDFKNYSWDDKLSEEAKKIKLKDITTEELEIKWHDEFSDKKVEVTFIKDSWLVDLVNSWNEFITAEERYEKQILETKKLEGLKDSLSTLNTEIANINDQIKQFVSEQNTLNEQIKTVLQGNLDEDKKDKKVESLKAERESIKWNLQLAQSEIIAKNTNKLSLEKEIRDLAKYDWIKVSDLETKLRNLKEDFKVTIEANPVFNNYRALKNFEAWKFEFEWIKGFMKDLKKGKFIK